MSKNFNISELSSQRDVINELIQQKERLVTEGRYLEANEIKNQINQIKNTSLYHKTLTLTETQERQNEGLEEAFNIELQSLIEEWDNKIQAFVEKGKQAEMELNEIHNNQMEELINNLTNKYPSIKYSKEYLENKTIELNLAKQERFKEAHYYKVKCDKLEQIEHDKYIKDRNAHIQLKAEILGTKQANEKKCLREKFDTNFELLNKQKDDEINQLSQKYKNIKCEMDYFHKKQKVGDKNKHKQIHAKNALERITTLIMEKTKSKLNGSKMSNSNYSSNRKEEENNNKITNKSQYEEEDNRNNENNAITENLGSENHDNENEERTEMQNNNERISDMGENQENYQ